MKEFCSQEVDDGNEDGVEGGPEDPEVGAEIAQAGRGDLHRDEREDPDRSCRDGVCLVAHAKRADFGGVELRRRARLASVVVKSVRQANITNPRDVAVGQTEAEVVAEEHGGPVGQTSVREVARED